MKRPSKTGIALSYARKLRAFAADLVVAASVFNGNRVGTWSHEWFLIFLKQSLDGHFVLAAALFSWDCCCGLIVYLKVVTSVRRDRRDRNRNL